MTIPVINISFDDIRNEFGGPTPMSLSQYYSGGVLVSNPPPSSASQTGPIPTSGAISFGNFKGVKKPSPVLIVPPAQMDMYGHSNGPWNFAYSGSYNATNLHFIFTATGGMPQDNSSAVYTWSWAVKNNAYNPYTIQIKQPQESTGSEVLPIPQNQPNNSIVDFIVSGDASQYCTYLITVTDGISSNTLELTVSLHW